MDTIRKEMFNADQIPSQTTTINIDIKNPCESTTALALAKYKKEMDQEID